MEKQNNNFLSRKSAERDIIASSGGSSQERMPMGILAKEESRTILAQSIDLPNEQ